MAAGAGSFTANQSPTATSAGKPNADPTNRSLNKNRRADADLARAQLINTETDASTGNDETAAGELPLWPTMALFASLAANVFFGWIAWDTHSKYQDFVEESNESDLVRERQSRRLRDEPRPNRDEIRTPRRSRDAEEAEFLNGGLEV